MDRRNSEMENMSIAPPSPLVRSISNIVGGANNNSSPHITRNQVLVNHMNGIQSRHHQSVAADGSIALPADTNSSSNCTNVVNVNSSSGESVIYLNIDNRPSIKLTLSFNNILQLAQQQLLQQQQQQHIQKKDITITLDSFDESNTCTVTKIINNTQKYYLKGIINSLGKQKTQCEDSHFLSNDFTTVGVADGVGSWRSVGVDSGIYSRSLMDNSKRVANEFPLLKPFEIIEKAYGQSTSSNIAGSSTICILKLISLKLYSGLVGDSSYLIIRKDKIIFRSQEQTHKPNQPYQLGQGSADKPSNGAYAEHDVLENDIIVIGTDGFFDNVFDEEILEAIKKVSSIETFYTHLMDLSKLKSIDVNVSTPISNRYQTKGGKVDDITVGCFVVSLKPQGSS